MNFFSKLNIKYKITLINTLFMLAIVFMVLLSMVIISNNLIDTNIKSQLKDVIDYNSNAIKYENSKLDFSGVEFLKREVYTFIYSSNGILIDSYDINSPFIEDDLQNKVLSNIVINGDKYYIYDSFIEDINGVSIWIRGVTLASDETQVVSNVLIIAFFALPIFVIIAAVFSYYISKKAFLPIQKIINTAKEINNSEDLSLRINLGSGNDEIYELANMFDEMFNTLENCMEREKDFTSSVSHELRTPTTIIKAQCEYLLRNNINKKEANNYIKVIDKQADKMSLIINSLLNLIRLEKGLYKMNIVNTNLSDMLRVICEESTYIKSKDMKFECNIENNIFLNIDNDLFLRMIDNIISNAFKYGNKDSIIKVNLYKDKENICIQIEDDGIGIDSNNIKKIFDKFYQVDSSRENNDGSMGLGLSMVNNIVKLHNAQIYVESKLNKGTIFLIKF